MKYSRIAIVAVLCCVLSVGKADMQPGALQAGHARIDRRKREQDRTVQIIRHLQRLVPQVAFDEQPFEDVLDWFREQGLKNIIVKWPRLDDYGDVTLNTPVTLEVHDLSLGELLELVLEDVSALSAEEGRLQYQIAKGVLFISTVSDFADQLVVRTYQIEDLLQKLVFFEDAPQISVAGGNGGGSGGRGSGGGSGGGGSTGGGSNPGGGGEGRPGGGGGGILEGGGDGDIDYEANRQEMVDKLRELIHSIKPESWKRNGGRGIARIYQDKLVVTQSIEVHEIIGGRFRLSSGK